MSDEPYIESYRHFQLYEKYIEEIVRRWPEVVAFKPTPPISSVETLASRIRICIASLLQSMRDSDKAWTTTVPLVKFLQIADDIVVSNTVIKGSVACGPREALTKLRTPQQHGVALEPIITQVIPKVHLVDPSDDLLNAVVILHHYKLLMEPSIVELTSKPFPDVSQYDVAVDRDGNTYTLV